ncbi:MAG: RodZ domain-containing protein [Clostridia bacterium]
MRELGELLRKAREAKGLAISDVQEATKIRGRYLEAMERGNFEVLPGEVYVRGFLRSYAEAVGLCGDEVVERYKAARAQVEMGKAPEAPPDKRQDMSKKLRMSRHFLIAVGAISALVVLVGAAVWRQVRAPSGPAGMSGPPHASYVEPDADVVTSDALTSSESQILPEPRLEEAPAEAGQEGKGDAAMQPAPVTPSPQPAESQPAVSEPQEASPAGEGHELSVQITERCWVRVVADGRVVFERSMLAGERATWHAKKSIRIKVGNASGIDVTYNGIHVGPLGKSGQVVERSYPED